MIERRYYRSPYRKPRGVSIHCSENMTSYPSAALWITGDLGLRGVVTTILPALVTWSSAKCSSNEVFIGAILKPLGRNDYKAISTHFDATPSSKFSAKFVYSFVTD